MYDFLLTFLIEKFPNNIDYISRKHASSYPKIKHKIFNLYSANGNADFAPHIFSNKKYQKSKNKTKPSGSDFSKPSSFFSKGTTSYSK
jgi:hypothetical protein